MHNATYVHINIHCRLYLALTGLKLKTFTLLTVKSIVQIFNIS